MDGAIRMQAIPTGPNAALLVGQPELVKVVSADVVLSAGATIRVNGGKVASGAVSQSIGFGQTVSGHKVEFPAEPAAVNVEAIAEAVLLIAAASYIIEHLHSPDGLIGGFVFWLLLRRQRP